MDLRAVDEVLRTTRSVRRRLDYDRPVEPEVIEECIDLAVQAPTGARAEEWRFLVLTTEAAKRPLADLYQQAFERFVAVRLKERFDGEIPPRYREFASRIGDFPALILACIRGRPVADDVAQQVALYGSILPAAWSLMLALRARGLGSTWTTLHLLHETEAAQVLGIPDDVTQTVLLPVGYMKNARLRPAERLPAHQVTFWETWGRARGD